MKRKITLIIFVAISLFATNTLLAQIKIGDNPNTININSVLELESTSKGLLFPRMSTTDMNSMVNPPDGMMIYNTTVAAFYVRILGVWQPLTVNGMGSWSLTGNAGIDPVTNFLGTTDDRSFRLRTNNLQRFKVDSTGKVSIGTDVADALLRVQGEGRLFPFGASMFNVALYSRPTGVNAAGNGIVYGLLSHAQTTTTGTYNAVAGRILQADTSLANLTGAIGHTNYTTAFGTNGINTALLGIVNARQNQLNDNTIYAATTLNVAGTATTNAAQDSNTYLLYTPAATASRKSYHAGRFGVGTQFPNARLHVVGEGNLFPFGASMFNVALYSRPTGVNAAGNGIVYGLLSHTQTTTTGTYNAVAGRVLQADTSLANLTGAIAHTNYTAAFGANGLNTALLGIVNARENQSNDNTIYAASTLNVAGTATTNAAQDSNTYLLYTPAATASRKSYHAGRFGVGTQFPNARLHVVGEGNLFPFGASMFNVALYSRPTGVNAAGNGIVYGLLSHAQTTTTGTYNAVAGRILQADTSLANLTGAIAHTNYTAAFGANGLNTALLGIVNARENQSNDNTIYAATTLNVGGTATTNAAQDSNTYLLYTPAATASRKSYHAGRLGVGTQFPNARLHVVGEGNLFPFGTSMFNVALYSRPTGVNAAGNGIVYGLLSHTQTTTTGTYNAVAGRVLQADTSLANLTGAIAHTNYTAAFGANGLNTALLGIVNARENQSNDNTIYAATTLNVAGTATTNAAQDSNTYLLYTPAATASRKSYHAGRLGVGTQFPNARLHVVGEGNLFPFGTSMFNVALYSRPTGVNTASNGIVYGVLSHVQSTSTGTYNAIAGRLLQADTSKANLTGAIAHANYTTGAGFNTALLGIVNARENQPSDATIYSGLRLTDVTTGLNAAQVLNTYTIYAPTAVKSYVEGNLGLATSAPATKLQVNGAVTYMPAGNLAVAVDNQAITVGDRSFIVLSPDAAPASRNITLSNGLAAGQVLIIKSTATAGNGFTLSNSPNVMISGGSFAGDNGDTISLIWDGSMWAETGRSVN